MIEQSKSSKKFLVRKKKKSRAKAKELGRTYHELLEGDFEIKNFFYNRLFGLKDISVPSTQCMLPY